MKFQLWIWPVWDLDCKAGHDWHWDRCLDTLYRYDERLGG